MKRLAPWLGAALLLVLIFGTEYATVQQAQRLDANYPQVQLAEDAASALNDGATTASLTSGHVNLASSLAPFVVIYNLAGQPVSSSGLLNGQAPAAPFGILQAARGHDYHAISWQPTSQIRIAAVTVAAHNYYVLSGRSLKEIERNENASFLLSFVGGLASLLVLGLTYAVMQRTRTT